MNDIYIPSYWTPEQAAAVYEFVEDIREEILAHYQAQIMEYQKENQCYEPEKWKVCDNVKSVDLEFDEEDIPF